MTSSSRARDLLGAGEAALFLLLAFGVLKVLGFRRIAGLLGRPHAMSPEQSTDADHHMGIAVHRSIRRVSSRLPRRPSCLVRSLAAQAMLRRRGVGCTLYLGVARGPGAEFKAHAWVRVGSFVVVGRRNEGFTVVMSLRSGGAEPPARVAAE